MLGSHHLQTLSTSLNRPAVRIHVLPAGAVDLFYPTGATKGAKEPEQAPDSDYQDGSDYNPIGHATGEGIESLDFGHGCRCLPSSRSESKAARDMTTHQDATSRLEMRWSIIK